MADFKNKVMPRCTLAPIADLLRWVAIHLCPEHLDVAEISTFRDKHDVRNFGFKDPENLPTFFMWARHRWEGLNSALYMVGSTTEHVAGEGAGPGSSSFNRARDQYIAATRDAVGRGARVILLAAATKRLFQSGELEKLFPGVLFTLGDNMTGLLMVKRIEEAARLAGLKLTESRVLVIGPYGLLGNVASYYLTKAAEAAVVGLGSPKRKELLEGLSRKLGVIPAYSYSEVGQVDLVVACNSSSAVVLTPERVDMIRREGVKLVVVDPSEPYALSKENYAGCADRVIRFDAGNGYSESLRYVPFPFGNLMCRLLRLSHGVTWGCFCEAMILAKHIKERPDLAELNWFDINPGQIKIMEHFFGNAPGQFGLPKPTCFSKPITVKTICN